MYQSLETNMFLSALVGFFVFAADIVLLFIGYQFFLRTCEEKRRRKAFVAIAAMTGKIFLLGGGIYWAVAVAHVNVLMFGVGAGFVLVVWCFFIAARGILSR